AQQISRLHGAQQVHGTPDGRERTEEQFEKRAAYLLPLVEQRQPRFPVTDVATLEVGRRIGRIRRDDDRVLVVGAQRVTEGLRGTHPAEAVRREIEGLEGR